MSHAWDPWGIAGQPLGAATVAWAGFDRLLRLVLLQDYNTRVVLAGGTLMGVTAGAVGVFLLLRRRALVSDVVSHAALPGIAIAFLIAETIRPGSGKSLPVLLLGALISGMLGAACVVGIRWASRIKEDAALAIVLSVFFGAGIALFTVVQSIPSGSAAGLDHFIFGKAASMVASDVGWIALASLVALAACLLLAKEFSLLCFDERFAAAEGWPVRLLDLALMGLVVGVTIIALQTVGLLLAVALLIVPPAAARFWTDRLHRMLLLSACIGGFSAGLGVAVSALVPKLPTGAVIVLAGSACFTFSLLFGRRGLLPRRTQQAQLRRRVSRHNLLRALYERAESAGAGGTGEIDVLVERSVDVPQLLAMRSWSRAELQQLIARESRAGLVRADSAGGYRLTREGAVLAGRVVRNHRLWELYLIHHAHVATSHVDRDADEIEHVLGPELVAELEALLAADQRISAMPASPHEIAPAKASP